MSHSVKEHKCWSHIIATYEMKWHACVASGWTWIEEVGATCYSSKACGAHVYIAIECEFSARRGMLQACQEAEYVCIEYWNHA